MKVGIVGVGKWGLTLARKLTEVGAEVVAYDRACDMVPFEGLGRRMKWQDMVVNKEIEAVVSAAPPPVTTEIFYACQREKKPCLLTKPLLGVSNGQPLITTTTFVDYVHLHSRLWSEVFLIGLREGIQSIHVNCTGPGPIRAFRAALDYGPHALSMIFQILPFLPSTRYDVSDLHSLISSKDGRELLWTEMKIGSIRATFLAGNEGPKMTSCLVKTGLGKEIKYVELERKAAIYVNNLVVVRDDNHDPLKHLVTRFLCEAANKIADENSVELSRAIESTLNSAIKQADASLPLTLEKIASYQAP